MAGTRVDLELADHLPTQAILGQHPSDGPLDDRFGPACTEVLEVLRLEATRIAGVAVIDLVLALLRCHCNLGGVDNDHEVAGVDMRSEDRLVLAPQQRGDLGGEAPSGMLAASITHH